MPSHRVKYLRLIEEEARRRGNLTNWVPFALETAPSIEDDLHAEQAAERFLRWLLGESTLLHWEPYGRKHRPERAPEPTSSIAA